MPTYKPDAESANVTTKSYTTNANNTTANGSLFSITGVVRINKLYGVVTTALGSNQTGGYFNLYDQSARVNITLSTVGVTMSSFTAGAYVGKHALAATLATIQNNNVGAILEPATAQGQIASEFYAVKKTGAVTEIDWTYTTTNTPTSGVIQFFCEWEALSADGAVVAL